MRAWVAGVCAALVTSAGAWAQTKPAEEAADVAPPQAQRVCAATRSIADERYLSTDPATGGSGAAGTPGEAEEVLGPRATDETGVQPERWWERALDVSIMFQPSPCAPPSVS